jgi:ataxin-10
VLSGADILTAHRVSSGVEPALRRVLHLYSSWSAFQVTDCESPFCNTHINSNLMLSSTAFPATRMAVQALSNIVTTNEDLTSRLWNTYLTLPEEQAILM